MIRKVNKSLLDKQRSYLVKRRNEVSKLDNNSKELGLIDGILNLLDVISDDIEEGECILVDKDKED